jgi:hypothetical protein
MLPLVFQLVASLSLNVDGLQTSSDSIEASGTDEIIEIPICLRGLDTFRSESFDRSGVEIDERNIRLIENLVEPILKRNALASESVWLLCRRQQFSDSSILDFGTCLL